MSIKKAIENVYYVENLYEYTESLSSDGRQSRYFGWAPASHGDFNYDQHLVYSYHSSTKFASPEEKAWSKKEKENLASLDDYRSYFLSLAGEQPEEFLGKWDVSDEELKAYWDTKFPTDVDQHLFVKSLAKLIVEKKKFIMYSRGYVVIELENLEDDGKAS